MQIEYKGFKIDVPYRVIKNNIIKLREDRKFVEMRAATAQRRRKERYGAESWFVVNEKDITDMHGRPIDSYKGIVFPDPKKICKAFTRSTRQFSNNAGYVKGQRIKIRNIKFRFASNYDYYCCYNFDHLTTSYPIDVFKYDNETKIWCAIAASIGGLEFCTSEIPGLLENRKVTDKLARNPDILREGSFRSGHFWAEFFHYMSRNKTVMDMVSAQPIDIDSLFDLFHSQKVWTELAQDDKIADMFSCNWNNYPYSGWMYTSKRVEYLCTNISERAISAVKFAYYAKEAATKWPKKLLLSLSRGYTK